jgi:hypothetical protein
LVRYSLLGTFFVILSAAGAQADDVDLTITLSDNSIAKVQIIDDPGPLNTWKDVTPGKFGVDSATFTNSSNVGNARGCGAVACWIANGFDIDKVAVGDKGTGTVNMTVGMDGLGDMTWTVTRVD